MKLIQVIRSIVFFGVTGSSVLMGVSSASAAAAKLSCQDEKVLKNLERDYCDSWRNSRPIRDAAEWTGDCLSLQNRIYELERMLDDLRTQHEQVPEILEEQRELLDQIEKLQIEYQVCLASYSTDAFFYALRFTEYTEDWNRLCDRQENLGCELCQKKKSYPAACSSGVRRLAIFE